MHAGASEAKVKSSATLMLDQFNFIFATRNPGAGEDLTVLAAAVQLRLRVAICFGNSISRASASYGSHSSRQLDEIPLRFVRGTDGSEITGEFIGALQACHKLCQFAEAISQLPYSCRCSFG